MRSFFIVSLFFLFLFSYHFSLKRTQSDGDDNNNNNSRETSLQSCYRTCIGKEAGCTSNNPLFRSRTGITFDGDADSTQTSLEGECETCLNNCYSNQSSNESGQQECQAATQDFNESYSQFTEACNNANMGGDCFRHLQRCRECQHIGTDEDESDVGILDEFRQECTETDEDEEDLIVLSDFNPESLGQLTSTQAQEQENRVAINRFQNCPARASEGLSDRRDDLQKQEEKVQDLQESLSKMKSEFLELQNEFELEKVKIKEEMQKAKRDLEDAIEQLEAEKEAKKSRISNEISELEGQIQESIHTDREISLQEEETRDVYREELSKLASECHNVALQKVSERRQSILQARSQGMHKASTANRAFQEAGLSSEEHSKRFRTKVTRSCNTDPNVQRGRQTAKRVRDSKLARLSTQRMKNEELRQRLSREVTKRKSQLPKEEMDFTKKALKLYDRTRVLLAQQEEAFRTMSQNYSQRITLAYRNLEQATQRLTEEKDRLRIMQEYVTAAQSHGQSTGTESNSVSEALSAIESAKIKAISAINACDCCNEDNRGSGSCTQFVSFTRDYYNLDGSGSPFDLCGNDADTSAIRSHIQIESSPGTED